MSSPSVHRSSSHDRAGLRSALKKDHVHPDPRPDPTEDGRTLADSLGIDPKVSSHSDGNTIGSPPHASGGAPVASGSYPPSDPTSGAPSGSATSFLDPSDAEAKKSSSSLSLAPTFQRRVGFDTFDSEEVEGSTGGGTGVSYSFTIGAKSASYCRARYTRTFLCCTDLNAHVVEYSVHALDWLLTNLVEDHDEIVVLRVIEPGSSAHAAWRASIEKAKREAERVLEEVMRKNGEEKQISIIVEFAIGPIEETIHRCDSLFENTKRLTNTNTMPLLRMVEIYEPDSLIVGTRGKQESLFKPMMGSISKYCVARSPVPVVVVRPEDKVQASLNARRSDSKRQKHLYQLYDDARAAASTPALQGSALERSTTTTPAAAASAESKQEKKGTKLQKFDTFG
ncbi:BZ3500_MvSof-1268-A1-R1_Chr10-2g02831 [Microbotryum saponariae]|uniref:BZ3500_MvSof-1268-A1-R1_Chr10-2g02831 protein n=1 Tax=Microbotryum saponariae TaxID=289078 RepID=A0A2X0L4N8_9BASI|nr:BZ3501_MvSof-1269-A2-R1_Chr10-2g02422 [Microbotryum saponariae]SDA01601.1 BZ3500_MvSof-1268-A1-R1_Chr10-2g02831 [Microbotryum saponariae]